MSTKRTPSNVRQYVSVKRLIRGKDFHLNLGNFKQHYIAEDTIAISLKFLALKSGYRFDNPHSSYDL